MEDTALTVPELFSQFSKDETIYYYPNPGNAGDALIAAGTYLLLEKFKVKYEIVDPSSFNSNGKIVMYGGGGNLVGIYSDAKDFILKHHKAAKQLILLPHTVANSDDLLSELQSNVILFARELVTYEYLLSKATNARVYLNKDLALYIEPSQILPMANRSLFECTAKKIFYKLTGNRTAYANTPQPSSMVKYSKFESERLAEGTESANFFRTDIEKALEKTPEDNMDLSNLYQGATNNKHICFYTVGRLMQFINNFDTINTDRLHICIASALLGKQVNFYANSYFKCKAIYEHSLKDDFKCVKWQGTGSQLD